MPLFPKKFTAMQVIAPIPLECGGIRKPEKMGIAIAQKLTNGGCKCSRNTRLKDRYKHNC